MLDYSNTNHYYLLVSFCLGCVVIVCLCANVSDRAIANAVREGCRTVDAITMSTGACSGCGQCRGHCEMVIQAQAVVEHPQGRTFWLRPQAELGLAG